MGKLVKYCSECEEGFAERFGFCPNCGGTLEAFEMNPIAAKDAETERLSDGETKIAPSLSPVVASSSVVPAIMPETVNFSGDDILELDAVDTREETVEAEAEIETFVPAAAAATNGFHSNDFADSAENNFSKNIEKDYSGYHITVVSDEASSWFKPFLLGLMAFAFVAAIASYVVAIWIHGFQIPEIDGVDGSFYSSLTDDDPVEREEIKKKNDKAGGGGGGGGNENPDPASRGRIPTTGNPTPLMIVPRMQNPSLAINNRVQDNIVKQDNGDVIGGGNADGRSSGRGKGGGIGTGLGTGIGGGEGTGVGNGRGSGTGDGVGNGNGDSIGDGDNNNDTKVPTVVKIEKPKPVGETKSLNITGKPRPNYTDAARQNNVQGTVTLRVTFNANGTIGGVTPVSSLPYGLTEQAISAAKRMTFQPAIRNGQPYAVTKTIQFSFTIY